MEVIGVFSSWVTALRKLSCCSLRRISRTRKMVLRMTPAIIKPKKMTPRMRGTISRQLRMIQLVLRTAAAAARQTPSVIKKAMVVLRLVMRMGRREKDSTAEAPGLPLPAEALAIEQVIGQRLAGRFQSCGHAFSLLNGRLGGVVVAALLQGPCGQQIPPIRRLELHVLGVRLKRRAKVPGFLIDQT